MPRQRESSSQSNNAPVRRKSEPEFDVESLPSLPASQQPPVRLTENDYTDLKKDHSLNWEDDDDDGELSVVERSVERCLEVPTSLTRGKRKILSAGLLCVALGAAINLAATGLQRDAEAVVANALSSVPSDAANLRPVAGMASRQNTAEGDEEDADAGGTSQYPDAAGNDSALRRNREAATIGLRSSPALVQKHQEDLKRQYPYGDLPTPPEGHSQHLLRLGSEDRADIQGQHADYVGLVQPPPSKSQYLSFVERESAILNAQYHQQQMAEGNADSVKNDGTEKERDVLYRYRKEKLMNGKVSPELEEEMKDKLQKEIEAKIAAEVASFQPGGGALVGVPEDSSARPEAEKTVTGMQGEVAHVAEVQQLVEQGEAAAEVPPEETNEVAEPEEVQEPSLLTQLMVEASQKAEANLDAEGQVVATPEEGSPEEQKPSEEPEAADQVADTPKGAEADASEAEAAGPEQEQQPPALDQPTEGDGDRPTDADMDVLQQEVPLAELNNFKDSWDPYEKSDNPVFWHIPKAGGSTVKDIIGTCHRFVMATEFGVTDGHIEDKEIAVVYPATGNPDQDRSPFVNVDTTTVEGISRAARMGFADSGLAEAVVTPFLYEANELFTQTARGRLFTVFRHPIERAVSMFYYLQVADWEPTYNPEMKTWTLEQYATSPVIENNWMVRQLSNTFEGDLNEDHLKVAMEVVRRKFLVGLMSEMEATVDRFEKFFRWTYHVNPPNQEKCRENLLHGGSNSNAKNKKKGPEPGSKEWELLGWQNQYDMRLYEYIEVLFKEQEAFVTGIPDNYRNMDATCCKCDPPTFPPEGFTCPQAIKG